MQTNTEVKIDDTGNSKKRLAYSGVVFVVIILLMTSGYLYWKKDGKVTDAYRIQQIEKVKAFEKQAKDSSIEDYLNEEEVTTLFEYANSLMRQHDFEYGNRATSTAKALDIYLQIASSSLPERYKVYAINEMYTAFIQSGSKISTLSAIFSREEATRKAEELGLGADFDNIRSDFKIIVYSNLLIDKIKEGNALIPTKIALARMSMQEYSNQMLFRTLIDRSGLTASSTNERIKNEFSQKVIANYEKYKSSEVNTLPGNFYTAEAGYLMAWSLNRAGIYSGNQEIVDESYRLFENNIKFVESVKSTNFNVWHLSILTKMFYATAILGENKDAYIDPEVVDKRNKALTILSELRSPDFLIDDRYYGARQYLSRMKNSDMDWITTLILLAKYDQGLYGNLKALGWTSI